MLDSSKYMLSAKGQAVKRALCFFKERWITFNDT